VSEKQCIYRQKGLAKYKDEFAVCCTSVYDFLKTLTSIKMKA